MQYLWNLVCLENLITFLISWIILKERFISSWNSTCHPRTALSTVFLPLRILLGLYPSLFILPGNISSLCLLQQSLPFPSLFGLSVRPGTHLPNLPVLLFHRPASLPLLSLFRSSLLHSCFLFKAMKNQSSQKNLQNHSKKSTNSIQGMEWSGHFKIWSWFRMKEYYFFLFVREMNRKSQKNIRNDKSELLERIRRNKHIADF